MNEHDLRDVLEDLAATPAPPSRVDVTRAMADARRRTQVRARVSVAASVLVVGLAAGVTYAVVDRSPGTGAADAATPMVAHAPARFDPLVRYASFGWLPEQDAMRWRTTSITEERFTAKAGRFVPDPANGPGTAAPAAHVELRLYAAGVVPLTHRPIEVSARGGTRSTEYGPVTAAPPVDGAAASWVGTPGDPGTTTLRWRYAPDGWAELAVSRVTGDPREVAHRVADNLAIGGTGGMRFPFRLSGLPAGSRPTAGEFEEGGPGAAWRASLEVGLPDRNGPRLTVAVRPSGGTADHPPNTTVDGHPARHDTVDDDHLGRPVYSDRLSVLGADGLDTDIVVDASSALAAARLAPEGVLGVHRALTVHADRSDWTGAPLG